MNEIQIGSGLQMPEPFAGKGRSDASPAGSFSAALRDAVQDVSRLQGGADQAIQDVQTGRTGQVHEAMIALEKADVAFRTMLQVRNRLIEAYQEVMRMQV
jgi:flagellar hook-basal body complex protein FliE